eukprot:gene4003-2858_t
MIPLLPFLFVCCSFSLLRYFLVPLGLFIYYLIREHWRLYHPSDASQGSGDPCLDENTNASSMMAASRQLHCSRLRYQASARGMATATSHSSSLESDSARCSLSRSDTESTSTSICRRAAVALGWGENGNASSFETLLTRLIVIAVAGVGWLVLCYFTTTTYTLTTDPSPYKNTMFHHFACDYAVVENKWTRRRTTISLEDERRETLKQEEERWQQQLRENNRLLPILSDAPAPVFHITKEIKVNRLKDRIYCYLQKQKSLVLVDVTAELSVDRFMSVKNDTTHVHSMERAKIAARRGPMPARALYAEKEPEPITQLLVQSLLRPLEVVNGYQKGELPRYEHTLQSVCREVVARRYHEALMERVRARSGAVPPSLLEELLAQGIISGEGITVRDVLPDLEQFREEVRSEVCRRMGEGVLLYDFDVSLQESQTPLLKVKRKGNKATKTTTTTTELRNIALLLLCCITRALGYLSGFFSTIDTVLIESFDNDLGVLYQATFNPIATIFWVSKKNLQLKCSECFRLLPSAHYGSLNGPSHTRTCLACKPMCVVCGIRKPLAQFREQGVLRSPPRSSSSKASAESRAAALGYHPELDTPLNRDWEMDTETESDPAHQVCDGCMAKEQVARTNVYFRFPILKYRSCPFPVEEFRDKSPPPPPR